MKRTTKIKSALATAVLCSLMTTAYAAPEQQDLNIIGSMQTTSADTFTGEVPAMHYLDSGYVKNTDGTFSKIDASMTNGRPFMVSHSYADGATGVSGDSYKYYWDIIEDDKYIKNTTMYLKKPVLGSYFSKGRLYIDHVIIKYKDSGVEKIVNAKNTDLGAFSDGGAYVKLQSLLIDQRNNLDNITVENIKEVWKDATNLVDGKQIKDIVNDIEEIDIIFMTVNVSSKMSKDDEVIYSYSNVNVVNNSEWVPLDYSAPIYLGSEYTDDKPIVGGDITIGKAGSTGGVSYEKGNVYDENMLELKHTYVTVKELNLEEGSTVNMVKLNTMGDNPRVQQIDDPEVLRRHLWVDKATLADNVTFKVGLYGYKWNFSEEELDRDGNMSKCGGVADVILFKKAEKDASVDSDKKVNVNIALGYVPDIKNLTALSGEVNLFDGGSGSRNQKDKAIVLATYDYESKTNLNVTGVTSNAEGIFDVYKITPVISEDVDANGASSMWFIKSYTYENAGYAAENVKALADFHVTGDKVVRLQQDSFFRNAGGRELIDRHQNDVEHDNNVWADYYYGKVSSSSTYGRNISQSYNGYQVGYDTLMVPNYKNGNIYVGAYLSKIDSDSTIASGKGELDSVGFGLYGTWAGNRGHYIDGVISVNDLDNEFNYANDIDGKVNGDYSHRYYTAAAQYGYRKHYDNGFFVEPKLSMSIGYGEGTEYQLSNGINAKMDDYKNIIGKAGAYVGKEFGNKGNVYVGAFYAHNYAKDMKGVLSYDNRNGEIATKDLDVVDLEDTWYEFNIGAKYALSPVSNIAVDYIKQTGSDIGNDWSLNCSYQLKF